jgi:hypothetical protein
LSIFAFLGINFNTKKNKSVEKVVVVESFNGTGSLSDSFCKQFSSQPYILEKQCNKLTEYNCSTTKCCTFNKNKCVAGNESGPIYVKDQEQYSYMH